MVKERTYIYKCRGPAARTALERYIALRALQELAQSMNVEAWARRIDGIYALKKQRNPDKLYGGNIGGNFQEVHTIIRVHGVAGVAKAWELWKNERAGCGQILDSTIMGMEEDNAFLQSMFGSEAERISITCRICPRCGDADPITLGRTEWPNGTSIQKHAREI